jgi:hypothetical protein
MMKPILLAATILAAASFPAHARLQLSITDGTSTFSCFDGQLGCDLSGGANNLLLINTHVDNFFVQIALAQSTFGTHDVLQLSSSNIENNGLTSGTLTFVASDTNFVPPVTSILESGSLTFNRNVGAGLSALRFWADPSNVQGANPLNTPGTLLDTVTGTAVTDPDSFSGSLTSPFAAGSPFSMTEGAALNLLAGGSITGFNQSMTTSAGAVPEPSTWGLFGLGFGAMLLFGWKRRVPRTFAA